MFSYSLQTNIEFGVGKANELVSVLERFASHRRALIVTDSGVLRSGLVQPIVASLQEGGWATGIFDQVAQNPRDVDCMAGVEQFAALGADVVVAIGGGSAMDTAKTIALLARCGGTPQQYADHRRDYADAAPIVCLPTTAGTGAEVTRSAVITESGTHRKMTLKHAVLRPRLAVLDPLLTITVPPAVTAATGVDALVHAIEGSTCTLATPISEAFGHKAMTDIVAVLPRAVADGSDLEARTIMLQGSLLAGLCFGSTDVAAVHCLAEALGGLYDAPHGVANAIFLPPVLRFNAQAHPLQHAQLARRMEFAKETDSTETAVVKLTSGIARFTSQLGIPRLRDLPYVRTDDFDRLAELSFQNGSTQSNIRPVTRHDYRKLLEEAYDFE